jgi:transposase
MANAEELTDEQWLTLEALLPELPRRSDGRGRPWRSQREVLKGVLWILRSGARWKDLPERFPPYQTCHRRYQAWVESGALGDILAVLAEDLRERGQIDLSECYVDGTFIVAKKGGRPWVPPSGAKARSSWLWQTLLVFLSPSTQRALARLKSPLSKQLWRRVSRLSDLPSSSATKLTTATRSTRNSAPKASR